MGVHRQRAECPSAVCGSKHPLRFQSRDTVSQGSDQASRILSSYLGDGSFLCGWSSQITPQQNVPVSRSFLLSANLEWVRYDSHRLLTGFAASMVLSVAREKENSVRF